MDGDTTGVDVLVFDDVEELDAIGPWEVLRFWQQLTDLDVRVRTVSPGGTAVRCALGLQVVPDGALGEGAPPDVLVHPGGPGAEGLASRVDHVATIHGMGTSGTLLTSVCTGAQVLAATGLLDGREATSHWAALDLLRERYPAVTWHGGRRCVDAGRVVTSAGVTTGIDMALHLVSRLEPGGRAEEVARVLEHSWTPRSISADPG